jgi:hypothetical protein
MFRDSEEKKPMIEKEARSENTQRGASQPDEKLESQKSLTDKINSLFTGTLSFKQTKEQKTMTNNEEIRPEGTQSSLQPSQLSEQTAPPPIETPEDAIGELRRIKQVLIGPLPEWCLPKVKRRAKVTLPQIDDSQLFTTCPKDPGREG